jgi:uncharacterized membrane protein (DUF106 family)
MSLNGILFFSQALDISFLQEPPQATFFIMILSLVLGLATSLVNRMMMDLDAYREMTLESQRVRQEMMEAMKSGNQRRIDKAQNRQKQLMSQQNKMTMDRMKISLFFMIPFILIWQLLTRFFGGITIAVFPFDVPLIPKNFSVANWYVLCSLTFNIIISRVLGLTFEIEPEEI